MKIRISRTVIIILIFVIVLSVFVVKLMGYQLVNGESYREKADKTTESTETIAAPRGEIVDRYGRTIATNRVGFTVTFSKAFLSRSTENGIILQVTKILKADGELWNDTLPISQTAPYEFNTADTTNIKRLFKITGIDNDISANAVMNKLVERYDVDTSLSPADIRTIVGIRYEMEARDFSTSNPFECASDVSMTTVTKISERSLELPGVGIGQKPIRVYTNGTLAPHVIGTISSIFAEEYAALAKKHYAMNDLIGRGGIEQAMESYLRGTDGERTIELNKNGKVTSETTTKAAKPGDTVVLTLDSRLQEQLQAALPATIKQIAQSAKGNKEKGAEAMSGAAVVLNVQTGEVLAMATYPSYDLNSYYKDYSALLKQAGNPLVNRCITGVYRPGSTFKPVVAVSALMCGAITSSTTFFCPGYLVKFGMTFHCDAPHGTENVIGGLKDSCNVFFYNTGWLAGITRIDATAKALG
ncbi:MAG: penicillin-binding transpeptidase domain-containing protein, partial [Clostridia bacterium]|nr:penicillin-binding transpeptidase domain-containing protein [Clostridia bacterium]